MSNKISDLTPKAQELFGKFKALLDAGKVPFAVVYTLRTTAEQQALFAKGRDAKGNVIDQSLVVTNCDGIIKKSNHQSGNAFDLTFADGNGNPYWPKDPVRWFSLGAMAESVGLVWGGRWAPIDANGLGFDFDHFEIEV